jgi:phosphoribosylformylglycinamidine synthase
MKFGVVIFPGSNCDRDLIHSLQVDMEQEVHPLWHKDKELTHFDPEQDVILLPGGFSYGDYLRCGAIARFSPMMQSVIAFAGQGGRVVGICNGFQILCEAGLLPGGLLLNANRQFVCKNVCLKVEASDASLTSQCQDRILKIPIAHGEGRYFADAETLSELERNRQILFRYCGPSGDLDDNFNPNGSVHGIAGICNREKNVFGMMPHPERATSQELGNTDGRLIFNGLLEISNILA